jgi:hypothetical protein
VTPTAALALALSLVVAPAPPTPSATPTARPLLKPVGTTNRLVTGLRRTPAGLSPTAIAPFVRILSPAAGGALNIGGPATFAWNGIRLKSVVLELFFPAPPQSTSPLSIPPGLPGHVSPAGDRTVKLYDGPALPAKVTIPLSMAFAGGTADHDADADATLRIRATTTDGGTVVDERPVRVLLPTVVIQQPAPGCPVKVGTSLFLKWAFPRAVPPQVRIFVCRPSASSFDSGVTWWGPTVNTGATGSASFVIPASALHPGVAPDKYHVRVEGCYPQNLIMLTDWPRATRSIRLLP